MFDLFYCLFPKPKHFEVLLLSNRVITVYFSCFPAVSNKPFFVLKSVLRLPYFAIKYNQKSRKHVITQLINVLKLFFEHSLFNGFFGEIYLPTFFLS